MITLRTFVVDLSLTVLDKFYMLYVLYLIWRCLVLVRRKGSTPEMRSYWRDKQRLHRAGKSESKDSGDGMDAIVDAIS